MAWRESLTNNDFVVRQHGTARGHRRSCRCFAVFDCTDADVRLCDKLCRRAQLRPQAKCVAALRSVRLKPDTTHSQIVLVMRRTWVRRQVRARQPAFEMPDGAATTTRPHGGLDRG